MLALQNGYVSQGLVGEKGDKRPRNTNKKDLLPLTLILSFPLPLPSQYYIFPMRKYEENALKGDIK